VLQNQKKPKIQHVKASDDKHRDQEFDQMKQLLKLRNKDGNNARENQEESKNE